MSKYLAKSNPIETLQEHTLELMKNYDELKKLYPKIKVDWEVLKYCCIYHDMGKINEKFQLKLKGCKSKIKDEIHHGHLSIAFIDYKNIFTDDIPPHIHNIQDYREIRKKILATSIFFHHNRKLLSNDINELRTVLKNEVEDMKKQEIDFENELLRDIKVQKIPSERICNYTPIDIKNEGMEVFIEYAKIKGLLNKIDYCASAHEKIEYENNFLEEHLINMLQNMKEKNPNIKWNDLQEYMIKNKDKNLIAIAQTGMGKTEAGLLWIGNNKGFFTLPLKTAINSIYERIINNMKGDISQKIALLHSDVSMQYLILQNENKIENEEVYDFDLEDYIIRSKQYSIPLTICTIDQIFDFVYKYVGCEIKMATLSYSKVIIDEIQMYSPKLLAVIVSAIEFITKLGGKFAILTATLPPFLVDELRQKNIEFEMSKPFIDETIRHSLKIENAQINSDSIRRVYNKNKVLVICNTVKLAQKLYMELIQDEDISRDIHLFHSNFIKKDRQKIEKEILNFTKYSKNIGIWICTQVVEASLDIDFDILLTELSDINGLFQRLGRCHRKRQYLGDDYNCHVFVGEDGRYTSGIGSVIDRKIFELSKEAIKNIDGKISESTKLEIINNVYTSKNLKNTKYYMQYENEYKYFEGLYAGEKSKDEVMKEFRNIKSVDIIPQIVYEDNKEDINYAIEVLNIKNKEAEDAKNLKKDKIKARQIIQNHIVSIPYNVFQKVESKYIEVTKYMKIVVAKLEYGSKMGVQIQVNTQEETTNIMERMV